MARPGSVTVAAAKPPFSPSDHAPEKRANQYNLKLTDAEKDILEAEASARGVTPLNLLRSLIAGLRRRR